MKSGLRIRSFVPSLSARSTRAAAAWALGALVTDAEGPAPSMFTALSSKVYSVPSIKPRSVKELAFAPPGALSGMVDQSGFQLVPPSALSRYSQPVTGSASLTVSR